MKQNLQEEITRFKSLMLINEKELSAPVPITKVNSKYGIMRKTKDKKKMRKHLGVDLWATSGTEVHSPDSGEVLVANFSNGDCGGTVTIKHPNGFQSRYCHLKDIKVSQGDKVSRGEIIGISGGNSGDKGAGNSRGAHLHFEIKKDGNLVDPMDYIDKETFKYDGTNTSNKKEVDSSNKKEVDASNKTEVDASNKTEVDDFIEKIKHSDFAEKIKKLFETNTEFSDIIKRIIKIFEK